jgi:hypothetical protein
MVEWFDLNLVCLMVKQVSTLLTTMCIFIFVLNIKPGIKAEIFQNERLTKQIQL